MVQEALAPRRYQPHPLTPSTVINHESHASLETPYNRLQRDDKNSSGQFIRRLSSQACSTAHRKGQRVDSPVVWFRGGCTVTRFRGQNDNPSLNWRVDHLRFSSINWKVQPHFPHRAKEDASGGGGLHPPFGFRVKAAIRRAFSIEFN